MRDELHPDQGEMARESWLCLGPADRLRWLDERIAECGGIDAPLPAWEDLRSDAEHFFACCLAETAKVYVAAGFDSLSEKDKAAFVKWAEKKLGCGS